MSVVWLLSLKQRGFEMKVVLIKEKKKVLFSTVLMMFVSVFFSSLKFWEMNLPDISHWPDMPEVWFKECRRKSEQNRNMLKTDRMN